MQDAFAPLDCSVKDKRNNQKQGALDKNSHDQPVVSGNQRAQPVLVLITHESFALGTSVELSKDSRQSGWVLPKRVIRSPVCVWLTACPFGYSPFECLYSETVRTCLFE